MAVAEAVRCWRAAATAADRRERTVRQVAWADLHVRNACMHTDAARQREQFCNRPEQTQRHYRSSRNGD
eukprot:1159913-Pelagomonas_calceolata.AAC.5